MNLKIGLVTGEFPPMQGGVGAFSAELARALNQEGHTVHIITSRQARAIAGDEAARISFRFPREPLSLPFAKLHPQIGRWRWPSLSVIADIVLRFDLDIVNVQYQPAAFNMNSAAINFLPWRLKNVTKTAVTFHDLRLPYLFPKAGLLRQAAVNFLARSAHGVIATNRADFEALTELRSGEGGGRQSELATAQIPIGSNITVYPTNDIETGAIRQEMGLDSDSILLGYFGFLNESKGADTLLDALAKLDSRFHLVFIGGQTGASDLANNQAFLAGIKQQIAALDLEDRVHWTGYLNEARVSAHLMAVDMLVMPYRDGASLRRGTMMAALAHGRPLVTTRPEGLGTPLISGQNCCLVPPNSGINLAAAVQSLADDGDLRQKLGKGAARLAAQFSWDKIARQTAVFYRSL